MTTRLLCRLPAFASLMLAPALMGQIRLDRHVGGDLSRTQYALPIEVNAIASGDVDGDGDVDLLLVKNHGDYRICFNANRGDYRGAVDGTCPAARQAALADFDGDGDLDGLLVGGSTAYSSGLSSSTLLRNDGAGNFTASTATPLVGTDAVDLVVVDLDRDGDQDAVVFGPQLANGSYDGSLLHWWRNDGTGNFVDATSAIAGHAAAGRGVVLDVDGDTHPDLVTAAVGGRLWFRNSGAGTFATVAGWSMPGNGTPLGAADLDGDGDRDLLCTDGWYANDGAGTFTPAGTVPTTLQLPSPAIGPRIALADFDGDGRIDVAGTDVFARPFVWLRDASPNFQDRSAQWFDPDVLADGTLGPTLSFAFGCCVAVDADGDGDQDLATGGAEGRTGSSTTVGIPPRVFANAGGQRFVDTTRGAVPWIQQRLQCVAIGDVDGDGDRDLVLNGDMLLRQGDDGRFTRSTGLPPAPTFASAAQLADVDGDGDLDLLAVRGADLGSPIGSPRAPTLARNDGGGHFTDVGATALPVPQLAGSALAVGDVDGDGDLDAVAGSFGASSTLHLWRNDGAGAFTEVAGAMPAPIEALAIELADLDGDGDRDVVAQAGGLLTPTRPFGLWRNDGSGGFTDISTNAPGLGVPTWGEFLRVVDLDADGDRDIALGRYSFVNDGLGTFTRAADVNGRVWIADLDEDGAPDNVLGGFSAGGQGIAVDGRDYPIGSYTGNVRPVVASGDLDRDGDVDLIVGGQFVSFVTNAATEVTQFQVLFNERRSLRLVLPTILGRDCAVAMQAALPGTTVAFVGIDIGRLAAPIEIAPFGLLWLDPATFWLHAVHALAGPDAVVEVRVAVPSAPAIAGLAVSFQALLAENGDLGAARLTAAPTQILVR